MKRRRFQSGLAALPMVVTVAMIMLISLLTLIPDYNAATADSS